MPEQTLLFQIKSASAAITDARLVSLLFLFRKIGKSPSGFYIQGPLILWHCPVNIHKMTFLCIVRSCDGFPQCRQPINIIRSCMKIRCKANDHPCVWLSTILNIAV